MKYAANFLKGIKLDNFNEIIINYNNQDRELVNFIAKNEGKRITLKILDVNSFAQTREWEKINLIGAAAQLSVCLGEAQSFAPISSSEQECIDNLEVPFFFGKIATCFEELNYLLEAGAAEVYLAEGICFNLLRARWVCDSYGAQIRVFPNVAQSRKGTGAALKKFFIRPEDVGVYEEFIDTFEFWGNLDRQEVLQMIYSSGCWNNELSALILDLDLAIDNKYIVSSFGKARSTCDHRCLKGEKCRICELTFDLGKKLEQNNFKVNNSHFLEI